MAYKFPDVSWSWYVTFNYCVGDTERNSNGFLCYITGANGVICRNLLPTFDVANPFLFGCLFYALVYYQFLRAWSLYDL